jgi:hypothetical protein
MVRALRPQALAAFMRSGLIVAVGGACASAGAHGTGSESSAREQNCGYELLRSQPGPEYVEIARIKLEGDADFGAGSYRHTRQYARAVREMVCEIGGDAVKNVVDAYGVIVRVIVFQRVRDGQGARAQPAGPAPEGTCEPTCPTCPPCSLGDNR